MKNYLQKGFTLVEVMVALGILVMTLSLLLYAFAQGRKSTAIAEQYTSTVHQSRLIMENLLSYSYGSSQLVAGTRKLVVNGVTGHYSVSISTPMSGVYVKNIFVTNYWVDKRTRRTNAIVLATSICEELHK